MPHPAVSTSGFQLQPSGQSNWGPQVTVEPGPLRSLLCHCLCRMAGNIVWSHVARELATSVSGLLYPCHCTLLCIRRINLSLRRPCTCAMDIIAFSVQTGLCALCDTQLSRFVLDLSVNMLLNINIFVAVLHIYISLVYQSNSHSDTVSNCRRRGWQKWKAKVVRLSSE